MVVRVPLVPVVQTMSTVSVIIVSAAVTIVKVCFPLVRGATWPIEQSTSVVVRGRPVTGSRTGWPVSGSMTTIVTVPHRFCWERPLGKPGGRSQQNLCGTVTIVVIYPLTGQPVLDPVTGLPLTTTEVLCSIGHVATRTKGKQTFTNVTAALTMITLTVDIVCTTGTSGTLTTIPAGTQVSLFDPCVQDFFWNYDNYQLKLLQVRFYPT